MNDMLVLFGWNLLIVVPVATSIYLASLLPFLRRRPALSHILWVIVLVKLLVPPFLAVPILVPSLGDATEPTSTSGLHSHDINPTPVLTAAGPQSLVGGRHNSSYKRRLPSKPPVPPLVRPGTVQSNFLTGAWRWWPSLLLLGSSFFVSIAIWLSAYTAFRRLRRLLIHQRSASQRAVSLARSVFQEFGLRAAPTLLIVDASVTPMLWTRCREPTILLPRTLVESLDDDQLRGVISHEVAHYFRRDHWANWFAFLVTSLFWWHPIAWFARREMTKAAEAAADALALETKRCSRKAYAETLLTVSDFVIDAKPIRSVLTVAFGRSSALQWRFKMIADSNVKGRVPQAGWILVVVSAACFSLFPAQAEDQRQSTKSPAVEYRQSDSQFPNPVVSRPGKQPPAHRLAGLWSTNTVTHGQTRLNENGFMFFTHNSGYSMREEHRLAQPFAFQATYRGEQIWIDLIGESGDVLRGICQLSEDDSSARFCFYFFADGKTNGKRPKSFEDATAQSHMIVSLERLSLSKRPTVSAGSSVSKSQYAGSAPVISPERPPQAGNIATGLGPIIPAEPVPAYLPRHRADNRLLGVWTARVSPAGSEGGEPGEMCAVFGANFAVLSDRNGKASMQFNYHLGRKDGQTQIDLAVPGEPPVELHGICEFTDEGVHLCFCDQQYFAAHGTPESVDEADSQAYTKVTLSRPADTAYPLRASRINPNVRPDRADQTGRAP